jgi:hypothetical protein
MRAVIIAPGAAAAAAAAAAGAMAWAVPTAGPKPPPTAPAAGAACCAPAVWPPCSTRQGTGTLQHVDSGHGGQSVGSKGATDCAVIHTHTRGVLWQDIHIAPFAVGQTARAHNYSYAKGLHDLAVAPSQQRQNMEDRRPPVRNRRHASKATLNPSITNHPADHLTRQHVSKQEACIARVTHTSTQSCQALLGRCSSPAGQQ